MILSEIRYLVGVHLGQKGLPPTVIAPVNNILSLLDEELTLSGFVVSNTIEKEVERLKNSIITMNYDPSEDEDETLDDLSIEDTLEDDDDDEDEDDIDFGDDDDED